MKYAMVCLVAGFFALTVISFVKPIVMGTFGQINAALEHANRAHR